ncbi:MAG: hypothetical protein Q9217_003676 [Psora testacea]
MNNIAQEILLDILGHLVREWSFCAIPDQPFGTDTLQIESLAKDLAKIQAVDSRWRYSMKLELSQAVKQWDQHEFGVRIRRAAKHGDLLTIRTAYLIESPFLSIREIEALFLRSLEVEALCCAIERDQRLVVAYLLAQNVDIEGRFWSDPKHQWLWLDGKRTDCPAYGTSLSTPLYTCALWCEGTAILKLLLAKGADVNSQGTAYRRTALHAALYSNDDRESSLQNVEDKIRLLLDHGADPMLRAQDGESLIHGAAERGYVDVMHLFLNCGVNIEDQENGFTPLMTACIYRRLGIARLLLRRGANTDTGIPSNDKYHSLALAFIGAPDDPRQSDENPVPIMQLLRGFQNARLDLVHWRLAERLSHVEEAIKDLSPFDYTSQGAILAHALIPQDIIVMAYLVRSCPSTFPSDIGSVFRVSNEHISVLRDALHAYTAGAEGAAFDILLQLPMTRAVMVSSMSGGILKSMQVLRSLLVQHAEIKMKILHSVVQEWYYVVRDPNLRLRNESFFKEKYVQVVQQMRVSHEWRYITMNYLTRSLESIHDSSTVKDILKSAVILGTGDVVRTAKYMLKPFDTRELGDIWHVITEVAISNGRAAISGFLLETAPPWSDQSDVQWPERLLAGCINKGQLQPAKRLLDLSYTDIAGTCQLSPDEDSAMQTVNLLRNYEIDLNRLFVSIAKSEGRTSVIRLLLEAGCDPNQTQVRTLNRPLVLACQNRRAAMVHLLLQHGASVEQDLDLIWLTAQAHGEYELGEEYRRDRLCSLAAILKLLIAHGASMRARHFFDTIDNHRLSGRGMDLRLILIATLGLDPNESSSDGRLPLNEACRWRSRWLVKVLLEKGAMLHADRSGKTPLMYLYQRSCTWTEKEPLLQLYNQLISPPTERLVFWKGIFLLRNITGSWNGCQKALDIILHTSVDDTWDFGANMSLDLLDPFDDTEIRAEIHKNGPIIFLDASDTDTESSEVLSDSKGSSSQDAFDSSDGVVGSDGESMEDESDVAPESYESDVAPESYGSDVVSTESDVFSRYGE